ncbi:GtrA family protein [Gilvimarinus agarilyticus]|uniref:GtrA family protein n=1 Tax=unclassified Gilvimarinus TaxID=2642066 RepID=UPI001C0876B5|nr:MULTISPECIES: GtrA family protein [unclassified Gilvimarinus]MBU2886271.1 GtrA family protein [Gilvimarinus agarilyticus]MDO6570959.1 GtrA family protein [Gilvimarinus sp. 2_MG-2023]MDO6747754.1 GtrA family protein [Gilvimarinus sp. 1_MG-2023]
MTNPLGHWGPQLARFIITGSVLSCADLTLFFSLVALGAAYEWANVAGLMLGYSLGFVLHHCFTFQCNRSIERRSAQKYLLIFLFSLTLGTGVLQLVLAVSAIPLLAKVASMATVGLSNFILSRRFVFSS